VGSLEDLETNWVRDLGERIGYGRTMELCEQLWNEKVPGGAHSIGPAVACLVTCPHEPGQVFASGCAWCCGSGRVTERVLQAMQRSE
jgi:hypothetical protein